MSIISRPITDDASGKPLFSGEHDNASLARMEYHPILDIFQLRDHHQESNILIVDSFRAEKKKIEMQNSIIITSQRNMLRLNPKLSVLFLNNNNNLYNSHTRFSD